MGTDGTGPVRAARRIVFPLGLLAVLAATTGCVGPGLLYTRVVTPYTRDFRDTPVGTKVCRVDEHRLREPVSGAGVSVSFTSRVLQEVALEAGITNLCHADLSTFSILNGIYEKKTLLLYGD